MKTNRTVSGFSVKLIVGFLLAGLLFLAPATLAAPRPSWVGLLPENSWPLYHEAFDELLEIYPDGATNAQVTVGNFTFDESWSGYALQRSGASVSPFYVPAVDSGYTNINCSKGMIRCWFEPTTWSSATQTNGTGPGAVAVLFELNAVGNGESANVWSLQVNTDGTTLSLIAHNDDSPALLLQTNISWQAGESHLIALDYSTNGTDLYVDGELVAQGGSVPTVPPPLAALFVGSSLAGTSVAGGDFDELCFFGATGSRFYHPLTATDILFYYNALAEQAALGPVTDEEIAARAARFAEQRAQREGGLSRFSFGGGMEMMAMRGTYGAVSDCPTNVPIYMTNIWAGFETNGTMTVTFDVVGGTNSDGLLYDVLGTTNLASGQWLWVTNTPTCNTVVITNQAATQTFYILRSTADSDASGFPDWWQLQYFGTTGVDPYAQDSSGDGWNYLQDYLKGFVPGTFHTPPPLQGVQAHFVGASVLVTWPKGSGAVTGYIVHRFDDGGYTDTQIPVGLTNQFLDTNYPSALPWNSAEVYYVEPEYSQEDPDFPWSNSASPARSDEVFNAFSAGAFMGSGGVIKLLVREIPSGTSQLRITRIDWIDPYQRTVAGSNSLTISTSLVTNGIYEIPTNMVYFGTNTTDWYVSAIWPDGSKTDDLDAGAFGVGFNNASTAMMQDVSFLLRAAGRSAPFHYSFDGGQVIQPTNYAFASFYGFEGYYGDGLGYNSLVDWSLPLRQNYRYRNFVFSTTNISSSTGFLNTGCQSDYSLQSPYTFIFPSTITTGLPPILPEDQTTWMVPYTSASALGITNGSGQFFLPSNISNYFGLRLLSVKVAHVHSGSLVLETLDAGNYLANTADTYYFYPQFDQPQFQTVGYYFGKTDFNFVWGPGNLAADALPGGVNFSPTNAQPVLIAGMSQILQLAAFSKQVILNGDTNKPVYISQYFDKVYRVDTNGNVTSQESGIISPYGEFFPTEPGRVALVTMPDENGQRGTGIVQVVSLQFDMNHDGAINPSWFGSDVAKGYVGDYSYAGGMPFTFWFNNNYDRGHTVDGSDYEQDDLGTDEIKHLSTDSQYTTNSLPAIPSKRDLEDYARLWVPGLSNLLAGLPTNYTVHLSCNEAQLRLFRAVEESGGTNYLFDDVTASNQVARSTTLYAGDLNPSTELVFNRTNATDHFIFCGVQPALVGFPAKLTLRIVDSKLSPPYNAVAAATVSIQIKDIKDMYERWTVGERPGYAPTNITQCVTDETEINGFHYSPNTDTNTPYILFVHGWNMETWEKDRFAETAFKRLYWQGYQGRFGIFRWPTGNKFSGIISALIDARNYDNSESNAWASATGLTNLLTKLNAEYPSHVYLTAHSMGNVVAGEALRLASSQLVNTYIAMQGAVPAHCYDTTTVTRAIVPILGLGQDDGTPNRYANYYTNGAPSYFSSSVGAGTYVNFYNTNDYALSTTLWQFDQNLKPDNATTPAYHYVTPSGTHPSGFYRQSGSFETDLYFPTNTYELFAYADEARCYALGAQADVGGSFQLLGVPQQVNLPSIWPADTHPNSTNNPYSEHVWHSAQFRSDNAQRAQFWNTVLVQMGLK